MLTFFSSPRWFFRLAFARFAERLDDSVRRQTMRSYDLMDSPAGMAWDRFVGRFSTFSPVGGYSNRRLRRLLWSVRFPSLIVRDLSYEVAKRIHRPYLGRFEGLGAETSMKVEWLADNHELATDSFGDMDWGNVDGYIDVDVPWSHKPEHWLLTTDTRGFVTGERFDSRDEAVTAVEDWRTSWLAFMSTEEVD